MNVRHESVIDPLHPPGLHRFGLGDFAAAVIGAGTEGPGARGASVLFVDTGRERVLIDAGNGGPPEGGRGWLVENLARAGVDPAEVDVVIVSHAHPDNVAGLADDRGHAVFPNARYFIDRREWGNWLAETIGETGRPTARALMKRVEAARAVVADRVSFIRPGEDVVPGVLALDARGHTRGHLAFVISSKGETLVHTADILCGGSSQLRRPGRDVTDDADCLLGAVTRLAMLAQLASDRCLTFVPRARFPGLGMIVPRGAAFGWRSRSSVGRRVATCADPDT
jgi:glyoxylase-like metal-dependent hydrolase (beta-lactamase superfamily II)